MQLARSHLTVVAPPAREAPLLTERDDDDLMLLARGGLGDAFDVLVRRHQRRALRLAVQCLGDPALAADAAQNAFVALLKAVHSYRAAGKFNAFFHRILLNQCHMARRRARSASWLPLDELNTVAAASEILAREQRRDVSRALSELSNKLSDAVLLRFGADLSYAEIADTLDIPVGTAKRRVFVAMSRLRELLDAE